MQTSFQSAGVFLVQIVFNLAIFVLLLRVLLQLFSANFYNPVSQAIVKVTDPILQPLRRFLPNYKGIDTSVVSLLLILAFIKFVLYASIVNLPMPGILGIILVSITGVLSQVTQLYFYLMLIVVIMSWLNPMSHHPGVELLHQLTEPLLQLVRRFVPPLGGFDMSPVAILIALKLIDFLVIYPLQNIGAGL